MATRQPNLLIGVTSRSGDPAWMRRNTQNYINKLQSLGATPVVLAPDIPVHLPGGKSYAPDELGRLDPEILNHLHGLVLSGGGDVDPKYFGAKLDGAQESSIDHKRDELELNLSRAALEIDIPIFGICRGCQVLNVAAGGSMKQDFDGHKRIGNQDTYHDVIVAPRTRLHRIVGEEIFLVNSAHHQGMERSHIAPIFTPSAIATPDEWLVEAYESPAHTWVIGVQWHPERMLERTAPHDRLWQSFLTACQERALLPAS